jgi:hypothetical protein
MSNHDLNDESVNIFRPQQPIVGDGSHLLLMNIPRWQLETQVSSAGTKATFDASCDVSLQAHSSSL